jgi:AcrR family transcriptional regulator
MARKPADKPRAANSATATQTGPTQQIISAALELSGVVGWRSLSMADIAARTGLSLAEIYATFPTKASILERFLDQVDRHVLSSLEDASMDESARDRLFDVVMHRFDALRPYKAGVRSILRDQGADPLAGPCALRRFMRSMAWMLEAAGLSPTGLSGLARLGGLGVLYASVFGVWLSDDTEDMSRTMAALDKGLGQVDRLITLCGAARPGGGGNMTPDMG